MKSAPIRKQFSTNPARPRIVETKRSILASRRASRDRSRQRVEDLQKHIPLPVPALPDPLPEISCTIDPDFDEAGAEYELDRLKARHRELAFEDNRWDDPCF